MVPKRNVDVEQPRLESLGDRLAEGLGAPFVDQSAVEAVDRQQPGDGVRVARNVVAQRIVRAAQADLGREERFGRNHGVAEARVYRRALAGDESGMAEIDEFLGCPEVETP